MKALIVTPYYFPKIGGLENYARQLGIALQELQSWELVVATSNPSGRQTIIDQADGMKIYRLGTYAKLSNTPVSPLWPLQLRHIIRHEKPDIILAHTPVPSMADAVALAAGRTPLLLTYHASTLLKGNSPVFNTIARAYGVYERLTLSRATRIIAVSDYVKAQLPTKLQAKTVVVPNAIWEHQIVTRTQPNGANFIFISSLDKTHAWKGLDYILQAVRHYLNVYQTPLQLTVVGDGNYREHYEQLVAELDLTAHVTFTGALTGAAKDKQLQQATALLCYPTTANDAFPTVMLEAWGQGVPVIAAAIGPIPSLINDRHTGYLVAPKNSAMLAEVLHTVAASSQQVRNTVAKTASARTKNAYTWEHQSNAIAKLAKELV